MKILWVTNILFSHHREMMGMDKTNKGSGSWLYAAYDGSLERDDIELHIVTSSTVKELKTSRMDGNYFYILPGGFAGSIEISSSYNQQNVEKLMESIKPDVAIIWGTESRLAYLVLKALKDIPKAIYIQGIINSIYDHYYDGIPKDYIKSTLKDYIDAIRPKSNLKGLLRQTLLEAEMLKMADGIIVENDWCEDVCKAFNPNLKVFRNKLPIKEDFYKRQWSLESIEPLTIFTNAGGYPIKGHHILFKALAIVRKQFPDFKCYIPGAKLDSFRTIIKRTGYIKLLEDLIAKGNLDNNIIYTGPLASGQMVDYLSRCNVYVMPSVMENHSSSLIEAMLVGTPSITSLVGGVGDIAVHKNNAMVYNSTDVEGLAGNIIRIFSNCNLAKHLSQEALKTREVRTQNFGAEMINIYSDMRM